MMVTEKIIKIIIKYCGQKVSNSVIGFYHDIKLKTYKSLRFAKNGFKALSFPYEVRKFGEENGQVFFGYYDVCPFSHNDSLLLANRAPLANVPPKPNTPLDVGFYRLHDALPVFNKIGTTTTWCWQQGCRLQWFPNYEDSLVIYNKLINGQYGSVIQNIKTKKIERYLPRPIYALSHDGTWGLTLNFSRLQRLRPGYGYVGLPDETALDPAPADDGIWLIDMRKGESELLFSVEEIASFQTDGSMVGAEHYFNHLLFSPDNSRFLFFHLWEKNGKRHARLITCNVNGKEKWILVNTGIVSHYNWLSDNTIICFSTGGDGRARYYIYEDKTENRVPLGQNSPNEDGHPSFSPSKNCLLMDSYPDKYGEQNLMIYYIDGDKLEVLGKFHAPRSFKGEVRCDLHPRWSRKGNMIAFDSADTGRRTLNILSLT